MSVTLLICILTGLVSYQALHNGDMFYKMMHYPYQEHRFREYYRWLTGCFLHANWIHLFINLFVFYQFGEAVEGAYTAIFGQTMGRILFLILYLMSGVMANVITYLKQKDNQRFTAVGASGAVSGILMAYVIFGPWNWLGLFFIIPVPAFAAAILYLVYSSWAAKRPDSGRIDHEAHFWGAVFGLSFTIAIKPQLFLYFLDLLMRPSWPF